MVLNLAACVLAKLAFIVIQARFFFFPLFEFFMYLFKF